MVMLRNEAKDLHSKTSGIFIKSPIQVDDRAKWIKETEAAWFNNSSGGRWLFGSNDDVEENICCLYSSETEAQNPSLVSQNDWHYNKSGQWIAANPEDIAIINIEGTYSNCQNICNKACFIL